MSALQRGQLEQRLLILAPVGRDASLISSMLCHDAVICRPCSGVEELARELKRGGAALLITEEALAAGEAPLLAMIDEQPTWSDLPVLLLTTQGADSALVAHALTTLGNVTLLERPVRVTALASAVRSALRARARQYQTRAYLQEREQSDERKNQFLAMLAHELRNPLAPIRNSLQLLRRTPLRNDIGSISDIMERQVNHMVRLVDDLMDVSRITRGKIELRKEPVELSTIIAAAVETSRPLIDSARHQLTVSVPSEQLCLDVDAVRMAQVFANLLNNAAKYTDAGGHIRIEGRREGGSAIVTVSDDGVGIPAHALPRVFDMFSQVDARDARSKSGLGIGLTLARTLVQLHGGSITAASEGEGRGSRFVVRLPLVHASRLKRAARSAALPGNCALHRILVVDDNRDAADTLGALLEMLGAEAHVVYDGKSALAAIDAFHPNVVVLDLGMPEMDGFEVARRIRARPDSNATALIALTGWGQEKDRHRTKAAGFNHHLVKPVDPNAMQAVLAALAA